MEGYKMKHSSVVITYLGYGVLFLISKLGRDYEKIDYYRKEMSKIIGKMNIDELLEILTIIDVFYSNRQ